VTAPARQAGTPDGALRGALVGTGSIARHHLLAWRAVPGVRVVALADLDRARAGAPAREFGIEEAHVYAHPSVICS
jgi:predicted dehydrogenase